MKDAGDAAERVVYFDGVCGLCDKAVQFLFVRDKRHRLRFATLQGETARQRLAPERTRDLDTMVYVVHGKTYLKSAAALRALADVGGVWGGARVLLVVPAFVRNFFYDLVVVNRYKVFGRFDQCRLPLPEERAYFLE